MTTVVKVGGAALAANRMFDFFGGSFCVVHGAGPQISLEMERAGIPVEFVEGRRVTTPAASPSRTTARPFSSPGRRSTRSRLSTARSARSTWSSPSGTGPRRT